MHRTGADIPMKNTSAAAHRHREVPEKNPEVHRLIRRVKLLMRDERYPPLYPAADLVLAH